MTDTLGLVVRVKVHSAGLQDRESVPLVLEGMNEQFPRVSHAWVDQGYTGMGKQWIEEHLHWTVEVVHHPPLPRGMWVFPGEEIDKRSEEHTSELQSQLDLVCRLLLEKKKQT